jgi:hypothetical protein
MLYFKAGTSGHLKIRTGYNLVGTNFANRGRLVANAEGTFAGTTALPYADKAIIDLQGTSKIDASYLDLMLYDYEPSVKAVRTYGVKHRVAGSASADTLTKTSHGLANAMAVMIMSSGTLPAPLQPDTIYFVVSTATDTFKLAAYSAGLVIDLTTDGTGDIDVYTGHTSTSTATMNVLDDVTAVTGWVTTDGHDHVVLANAGPQNYDQQRLQLTTINAETIVLSANVDSVQYPGAKIYLISRNISIRSTGTVVTQAIIDYGASTFTGNKIGSEIRNSSGTGVTFYSRSVNQGYGHTFSGTIFGADSAIYGGSGHTVSGVVSGCNNGVNAGSGHTISGVVSGCSNGVNAGSGHTISGVASGCNNGVNAGSGHTISGVVSGCNGGVNIGSGHTISGVISGCNGGVNIGSGHTISGVISGCVTGVSACSGHTISGVISGCVTGVNTGSGHTISGVVSGCTTGVSYAGFLLLGSFSNNTTDVVYSGITAGPMLRGRAFKYGGVANATHGWSAGGTLIHETTTVPANHAYSHKFTYVDGGFWNVFDWEISRTGANHLLFPVFAKHDATGLTADQRLHFQIINLAADPLVSVSNTPLAEWIAADSVDWQSSALSYTKADDMLLVFRICAKRASGDAYALFDSCTVQTAGVF